MAWENIRLEIKDKVGILTFDRPKVLNALDPKTFNELEDLVGNLGQEIEAATLRQLVQVEDKAQGGVKCPECGQMAQNKGLKKRQIVSRRGTVEVERRYYHCGHCQHGFFPPR